MYVFIDIAPSSQVYGMDYSPSVISLMNERAREKHLSQLSYFQVIYIVAFRFLLISMICYGINTFLFLVLLLNNNTTILFPG